MKTSGKYEGIARRRDDRKCLDRCQDLDLLSRHVNTHDSWNASCIVPLHATRWLMEFIATPIHAMHQFMHCSRLLSSKQCGVRRAREPTAPPPLAAAGSRPVSRQQGDRMTKTNTRAKTEAMSNHTNMDGDGHGETEQKQKKNTTLSMT